MIFRGSSTCCNARAGILVLLNVQCTHIRRVWISSRSCGNRYNTSDQVSSLNFVSYVEALALLCLLKRFSSCFYKGDTWKYIHDHVHLHMGKWYAFLELFDVGATKHMSEILACRHQSIMTKSYFKETFFKLFRLMLKKVCGGHGRMIWFLQCIQIILFNWLETWASCFRL